MLNLRGGMMHRSSGVVSPTNPLACTCHATLPKGREGLRFVHKCGIGRSIIATNHYCAKCTKFNCEVAAHAT